VLTDVLSFDLQRHVVWYCDRNGRHAALHSSSTLDPATDTQRSKIRR
jgi:hypothetical protein